MAEAGIVRAIISKVHLLFAPTYGGAWAKHSPSLWSPSGYPDITGCGTFNGKEGSFIAIECKSEDYKDNPMRGLSQDQLSRLIGVSKAGGVAVVVNTSPSLQNLAGLHRGSERRYTLSAFLLVLDGGHFHWQHGTVCDGLWFPDEDLLKWQDTTQEICSKRCKDSDDSPTKFPS